MFEPTFSDPLSTLKASAEFVRSSFPMATLARSSSSSNSHGRHHEASSSSTTTTSSSSSSAAASAQRRRGESQQQQAVAVPATPGRPLQFFTSPAHHQLVAPRRSVPSKWEDAEKWLRQSSASDHGNGSGNGKAAFSRQRSSGFGHRGGAGGEDEKRAAVTVRRSVDALRDAHSLALYTPPAEVLLKGVICIASLAGFVIFCSEIFKKFWRLNLFPHEC